MVIDKVFKQIAWYLRVLKKSLSDNEFYTPKDVTETKFSTLKFGGSQHATKFIYKKSS